MNKYKKLIGLVLTLSPLGTIVSVVGRHIGMEPLLANAMGLLFGIIMLVGIILLLDEKVRIK